MNSNKETKPNVLAQLQKPLFACLVVASVVNALLQPLMFGGYSAALWVLGGINGMLMIFSRPRMLSFVPIYVVILFSASFLREGYQLLEWVFGLFGVSLPTL